MPRFTVTEALFLFLVTALSLMAPNHAQLITSSSTPSPSPTTPVNTSFTPTKTNTGFPVCGTSGSDWHMDPPTAVRLINLFCDELYQPVNFPDQGYSFWSPHYPGELSPLPNDTTNYTAIERSGLIARLWLTRLNTSTWDDGSVHVHGSAEQCSRDIAGDACHTGLARAVDLCKVNNHYVGGDNMFWTDCGFYNVHIANCSGNWVDRACDRWHALHPDVGLRFNESYATATAGRGSSSSQTEMKTTTVRETTSLMGVTVTVTAV